MDSFIVELTLFCAVAIALVATHRKRVHSGLTLPLLHIITHII